MLAHFESIRLKSEAPVKLRSTLKALKVRSSEETQELEEVPSQG